MEVGHAREAVREASAEAARARREVTGEAATLAGIGAERAIGLAHVEPARRRERIADASAALERREARAAVRKTHRSRPAHAVGARGRTTIARNLTDEPIVLTGRSTDVVVAGAVATFVVAKTRRALRLAGIWSAKPVRTQSITAFVRSAARSALGFAFDASTEAVEAVEVAALLGEVAGLAGRRARHAATEATEAVEVAALDGRRAGRTLWSADLLGFAQAVHAEQIVAASIRRRTCVAEFYAGRRRGVRIVERVVIVIARARSAGSEREHQGRDERANGCNAGGKRRTHASSLERAVRKSQRFIRVLAKTRTREKTGPPHDAKRSRKARR